MPIIKSLIALLFPSKMEPQNLVCPWESIISGYQYCVSLEESNNVLKTYIGLVFWNKLNWVYRHHVLLLKVFFFVSAITKFSIKSHVYSIILALTYTIYMSNVGTYTENPLNNSDWWRPKGVRVCTSYTVLFYWLAKLRTI